MRSFHYRLAAAALCLGTVALSAGCALGTTNGHGEDVGEAQSAFGESSCGTDTSGAVNDTSSIPSCGYSGTTHDSGGTSYGDSLCTGAFKVRWTGSPGPHQGCSANAILGANPTVTPSSSNCSSFHTEVITYDSTGTQIASDIVAGSWNGSACVFSGGAAIHGNNVMAIAQAWLSCGFHCATVEPVAVYLSCPVC